MDPSFQWKINLNRLKYGNIFLLILDIINRYNLFSLVLKSGNCSQHYIEFCESLFEILIKEATYHNYILHLDPSSYDLFIDDCIDRSIPIKDKYLYELENESKIGLRKQLKVPLENFLIQLKIQIKKQIEIRSSQSEIEKPNIIEFITAHELENKFAKFEDKVLKKENKLKSKSIKNLPQVKMQPIHPRPPIINDDQIIFQKNLLDL